MNTITNIARIAGGYEAYEAGYKTPTVRSLCSKEMFMN